MYSKTIENPFGPFDYIVTGDDETAVSKAAESFESSIELLLRGGHWFDLSESRETIEKRFGVDIKANM